MFTTLVFVVLIASSVGEKLEVISEKLVSTSDNAVPCVNDQCTFTLIESIPEGLVYPPGSPSFLSAYDAHKRLLQKAKKSVHLGTFYWTLRGSDVTYHDNSSYQGDDLFEQLKRVSQDPSIDVKIAENEANNDTAILASVGAQVRTVDFERLLKGGVLHTKLWIVDEEHFATGSPNFDWRSYTQVKELGVLVENCPCLAKDITKAFEVYWYLGQPNSTIPSKWPDALSSVINVSSPASVHFNQTVAPVYMSSSPPSFCPDGRTKDLDAILTVIESAKEFIYISVMDYFPAVIYTKPYRFWPVIDDALRRAVIERKITLHLMGGHWIHTDKTMYAYLRSLAEVDGLKFGEVKVNMFTVPATESQRKIPFARVNHSKFMVTDQHAYIGTSNWSGDYFTLTAGVGFIVYQPKGSPPTSGNLRQQLEDVFIRDFTSQYSKPVCLFQP